MKKIFFGIFALTLVMNAALFAAPETRMIEMEHDPYGIWQRSKNFRNVSMEGARVVDMPEEQNFFAYWVPKNFKSGRVMVAVHGTGGNPYEELKDEIPVAKANDYMVVSVNWYKGGRGGFMKARDLYRNILQALHYVHQKTGNDLSAVAYIGFSRGAAISYEVAHLDSRTDKVFDLFIAHSGGIPKDFRVEAKDPNSKQDLFFSQLAMGELGPDAFKGTRFFLYSGDKDESWGPRMSEQMLYAAELINQYGGEVVEYVRDPNGGHAGLRKNPSINEKAVRHFIRLTTPQKSSEV